MTRASALDAAAARAQEDEPHDPGASDLGASADRRLNDSNRAWLGRIIDGRYRVLEVIGRGGMGVVYRVEHLRMGKVAAMKVLHRDLATDPGVVQRFEREAAAVSRLHHPHTVQVFDFGTAQGALYLIMEYVRGLDMAHVISRDGPMPWARAAPLLAQICGALQEAHELGIVHRDLKPENVLITRSTAGRDYAKVLDFGLAKLEQRNVSSDTNHQQIVGTPYFMSPEQIRGDDVDARTDIYSFGALMFELLTGQHMFSGSTAVGVLTKHLTNPPDAPSQRAPNMAIDQRVDRIFKKATAKEPRERWQTASELGAAVEDAFSKTVGNDAKARPPSVVLPIPPGDVAESDLRLRRSDIDAFEKGMRLRRGVTITTALSVLVVGAGAAVWVATREPPTLGEEREPNNDIAHANKIAAGTEVTGYLGKRLSTDQGDRDVFLVPWSSDRHIVTVRVTGIPNIDLKLTLTDADGLHAAVADEGGVGEGEVLHRRGYDGPLVVTIEQTLASGQKLPVENVSDPYTLTVQEDPAVGEVEPNGTEADANPLTPNQELRGYLDARDDVDMLRWNGPDGDADVVVRADGLPLVWRTADGKTRTPGAARVTLHKGDFIRIERSDRSEHGSLPARDAMWSITATMSH
jgi:eukaryotic-like serine/threonine-protein kinase